MAKIADQIAVIRISKLVKNQEPDTLKILNQDIVNSMQEIIQKILEDHSDSLVVEVEFEE